MIREKITSFETVQTMVAFLLAASSLLYFGSSGRRNGVGDSLPAVVRLQVMRQSLSFLDRAPEQRNYRVFATWSAALLLAGGLLCLPPYGMAAFLGAAAILATVLGVRPERLTLEFHGVVYLVAAAGASGLLDYAFRALAGPFLERQGGLFAWSLFARFSAMQPERPCPEEPWKRQLLHIVSASLATGRVAALLVSGSLMRLTALNVHPGAHHLAFIRDLILCVGGSRTCLQRLPLAPDGTDPNRLRHAGAGCGEAGV